MNTKNKFRQLRNKLDFWAESAKTLTRNTDLRDRIAEALLAAYRRGRKDGQPETSSTPPKNLRKTEGHEEWTVVG